MKILFIDYETYWADNYNLKTIDDRKACRTEYIHDDRFKAHGMAAGIDDGDDEWITGRDLRDFWGDVSPHVDAVCAFNGIFDHGITYRFFSKKRFFLIDPMSMAIGCLGSRLPDLGMSLNAVARHLFPDRPELWKDLEGLAPTKNVRDLPPALEASTAVYAKQDNRVQRAIFRRLLQEDYPWHTELHNIHITLAMGVYPVLHMDSIKAAAIHAEEVRIKEQVCAKLGVGRETLRSNDKFADLLRSLGVDPPMKPSPKRKDEFGQPVMVYAFAAKDPEFMELRENEDSLEVQAVCEARVGEKAAQVMSRAATFARLPSPCPVPMQYAQAHTGRHGGQEFNMLNLKKKSALRGCIKAPKGKVLLVSDLSQAELMLNAWWCGEHWLLELIRNRGDVYSKLATVVFGHIVTKAPEDEDERFVGKQGELASQYGAAWRKILRTLRSNGAKMADEPMAKGVQNAYRSTHPAIVARWGLLRDRVIPSLAGRDGAFEVDGVVFKKGYALLPSGRRLNYPDLHVNDEGDYVYRFRERAKNRVVTKKLWHGLALENIVQAMQFDLMMHHARILDGEGIPLVGAVYDESWFVVDENKAEEQCRVIEEVQTLTPDWCKDLPARGEAKFGKTYLEAK